MFYSSVAVLALSASAVLSPFSNLFHLHSHAPGTPDNRVTFTLYNPAPMFQDVRIAGTIYTVLPGQHLGIRAPEGTVIYAGSTIYSHKRGDVLLTVTAQDEGNKIPLK